MLNFPSERWGTVLADIEEAAGVGASVRRVFLCDGDALILPTRKLLRILEAIRTRLPWIERVGVYGDTRSVGRKSVDELIALREAGLGIIYHGAETGSDAVMTRIDKGVQSGNRKIWRPHKDDSHHRSPSFFFRFI